jgi:hypothetical protein
MRQAKLEASAGKVKTTAKSSYEATKDKAHEGVKETKKVRLPQTVAQSRAFLHGG